MKAKLCNHAGCNTLIAFNERYCQKHITEAKKRVPFEHAIRYNQELYNTAQWRKLRHETIKEQPYCSKCGIGKDETPLQVHHITPPRGNEALFFDENNLIVVCADCHRIITAGEIKLRFTK